MKPKVERVEFLEIARDLYRISVFLLNAKGLERPPFHSYFLVGVRGNVLFDPFGDVRLFEEHAKFFDDLGGIGVQALNHEGDASEACAHVQKVWGAPVWVNEWDLEGARKKSGLAIERGFKNDEPLAPEVESVHLPGHSVGQTGYRVAIDGKSYLICGHAIRPMPTRDRWTIGAHPLMLETALRSMSRLRDLEVDFLLPDRTNWGLVPPLPFGPDERAAITDSVRAQLEKKLKKQKLAG